MRLQVALPSGPPGMLQQTWYLHHNAVLLSISDQAEGVGPAKGP